MLFKCRSIERRESLTYMLRRFMALLVVVEFQQTMLYRSFLSSKFPARAGIPSIVVGFFNTTAYYYTVLRANSFAFKIELYTEYFLLPGTDSIGTGTHNDSIMDFTPDQSHHLIKRKKK